MTVNSTIFDAINDNWGNGGYAGDAPTIVNAMTTTTPDVISTDLIEVYPRRMDPKPVNDTYDDKTYTIVVAITSKTSAAQLKLLADEAEYNIRNTTYTGLELVSVGYEWDFSLREVGKYGCNLITKVIARLSDGTVSASAASSPDIHDLLMWGSANAAWVPCAYEITDNPTKVVYNAAVFSNVDGTDLLLRYMCPLPTAKGSLKLYVDDVRVGVKDADDGDYLSDVAVYGVKYTEITVLNNDATNRTSANTYTYSFTAKDASSYDCVIVRLQLACADANDVDITSVELKCYYST